MYRLLTKKSQIIYGLYTSTYEIFFSQPLNFSSALCNIGEIDEVEKSREKRRQLIVEGRKENRLNVITREPRST